MNICEATKKALEENKCIREKPYKVKVKPIKGDVGTIMGLDGSQQPENWFLSRGKLWNKLSQKIYDIKKSFLFLVFHGDDSFISKRGIINKITGMMIIKITIAP